MNKENIITFIKDACAAEEVSDEMVNNVKILLSVLSEREERIIRLRYGLDDGRCRTLLEVSMEFGVTREKVRQEESTAIKKLRSPAKHI